MRLQLLVVSVLAVFSLTAQADATMWDLSSIYPSDAAWQTGMDHIKRSLPDFKKCKGRLTTPNATMKKCLDLYFQVQMESARVGSYASLNESADVKSSRNGERVQLVEDLGAKIGEATAFFGPELSKLSSAKMKKFLALPGTAIYRQYLRATLDQARHILDPAREELLSGLSPVLWTGGNLHDLLMSSDMQWQTIELSDHSKVKVDMSNYEKLRQSPNRSDRQKAFAAFFQTLAQYQHTLGANLASTVKTNVIMANIRHYKGALDAALDGNKIPDQVYRTLVAQVNEGLPVFQRYLRHKAKTLKVKDYSYEDAYVSSSDLGTKFPVEKAEETVLAALAPLGPEYVNTLKNAFSQQWMDVYPREGKTNGAFMDGSVYEVHPFLHLNQHDDFESMSTLAHEWGHAMNTIYSNKQAYVNSVNPTFLAEIASTFNEILLHEYMIRTSSDKKEKAYYLESLLQLIRGTFYRQTQFGEFELALHETVEKGGALTGDSISKIYGDIFRRYYGHDKGVMRVDEKFFTEWVMVPHFYNSFYVYQYATCISAAFYFAEHVLNNTPGALDNYIKVLQAGSVKYPYEVLKDAGVDMAKPDVYRAVVRRADKALDQLQELGVD